jgi:putative cardiolipin synthase
MLKQVLPRSVFLSALSLLLLSACATAPFDYPRESSVAISSTEETTLGREVAQWLDDNDGLSGFYPLIAGKDAFGARLQLMALAEKSIDAQYFLMKGDSAGLEFAVSMLAAADRGVRVRFLLDDVFTSVADEELELLDAHPNIEVRLYNPIARRGLGIANYLMDFKRANRRMHNKSFTVDNQVTIIGGRNIADEYFELRPEGEFLDFDVVGMGPVAVEVSAVFDRFWNNSRSVPMEAFASEFSEDDLARARGEIEEMSESVGDTIYREAVNTELVSKLFEGNLELYSSDAEVITDEPDKLMTDIADEQMVLVKRLADAVAAATEEVIVFTPYFVPGEEGIQFWKSITAKGVRVLIVTNSLASNNHTAVHSGYARYRKGIIDAGVELYEARADAVDGDAESLTLHTKGMIIDRQTLFVGSLNLDPRSIEINSEMGLLIPNDALGASLAETALNRIPEITYRVTTDERGKLLWTATIDGVQVIEDSEPLASGKKKFGAFLMRILPESQL